MAYSNNINVGTATVTITGKGNYAGTITKNFTIGKGTIRLNITGATQTYDGAEHTIGVSIAHPTSGATITYGTEQGEYTLTSPPKYVEVGTYDIYYKATAGNNYNELEGVQKLTIEAIDLSTVEGSIDINEYTYDGNEKTPVFTIKKGNVTLNKGEDYTVSYNNNINAGEATAIAKGTGHYKGTMEKKFTIKPQDFSNGTAKTVDEKIKYNIGGVTPELEVKDSSGKILEKDKDYTVAYSNNINVGIATYIVTGINNYTGKMNGEFTIENADIEYNADDIEITFDGKPHGAVIEMITQIPDVDIKFGTSKTECYLEETPTYTDAGTYKIYYTMNANNYNDITGFIELVINPKDVETATISEITEEYVFDTEPKKPVVEVKDEIKTLILDKDYTLSYENNTNAGTASVVVTGIGNYTGVNKVDFEIQKGDPIYMLPSGIVTYQGAKLKNVKLPAGFVWEDDLETDVGEIGYSTFKCSYIPEDNSNYNNIKGLEVTIKVTDKLVVNIEKYLTRLVENEDEEEIIYITGITIDEGINNIKEAMETNGEILFYEANGAEIANEEAKVKTGIKAKVKTEAEEIEYILVVTR
ncbi:MAG: hypothetical protein HFJ36_03375 [Clostridia bacterium]|nr:hypothetical protein [Clostridia bacterium]